MSSHIYRDLLEEARRKFNDKEVEEYIRTLYAPDARLHFLPPDLPQGWPGARLFYNGVLEAFPDWELIFEESVVEGDLVVIGFRMEMTHLGDFQGIPATGRRGTLKGFSMMRFAGGKVVERWSQADFPGLLQQLGVLPVPEQGTN